MCMPWFCIKASRWKCSSDLSALRIDSIRVTVCVRGLYLKMMLWCHVNHQSHASTASLMIGCSSRWASASESEPPVSRQTSARGTTWTHTHTHTHLYTLKNIITWAASSIHFSLQHLNTSSPCSCFWLWVCVWSCQRTLHPPSACPLGRWPSKGLPHTWTQDDLTVSGRREGGVMYFWIKLLFMIC